MIRRLIATVVCGLAIAGMSTTVASAGEFEYQKNGSPINGSIRGVCGHMCWTAWYRAGSGNGGMDGCQYYNWIPNGYFNNRGHWDNYAGEIQGRVWYLDDYYCGNGVTRTELFVHSEERSDQTSCQAPYDERYCWDGDGDYYSLGCIKVARLPVTDGYSDLGRLDNFAHSYGIVGVNVHS